MPSKEEKQKRKAILDALSVKNRDDTLASLPLPIADLKALFDFLDEQLSEADCDDTLRMTRQFLKSRNLPVPVVSEWLATYGGHCDCEALANVEEKFEDLL
jgi:hypothetical protein